MFTAAQLRVFLRALCNLDPYTITEDVAEYFAEENNDHQQTPEEILAAALSQTPDEKLTNFALRLALTGYVTIQHENELDYLAEAEAVFVPPPPPKKKPKANKPTLIKTNTRASPKTAPKKAAKSKNKVAA
jgi:ParB family chromosome partitioning protein